MYIARLRNSLPNHMVWLCPDRVGRNGMRKARGRHILAYYESVFITRQDLSVTQVEELIELFTKIIDDEGGKVALVENWGLRSLAYRIKKNRKGHYVMMHLDAPSAAVREMERQMGISENVLRQLTIKLDEFPEGPSVMMRANTRDDRPRRPFGGDDRPPREPRPAATAEAVTAAPVAKAGESA